MNELGAKSYHSGIAVRTHLSWIRRRKLLSSIFGLIVIAALLLLLNWRATLVYLGNFLECPDSQAHADLILVLAGDFWGARVIKGADLAVRGQAPLVLISGSPYRDRPEGEFAIPFLTHLGYPRALFESFGHHADSTIQESLAVCPELRRRGAKKVLMVTSGYHSRRAAIVFGLFCPDIQFVTVGAPEQMFVPAHWWTESKSRRLFFSEWLKICGTVLFEYPKYRLKKLLHG